MSKVFKQSLAAIMVVLMILTSAPLGGFIGIDMNGLDFGVSANAKTVPASGLCGKNVTYTYNSTTKELVISGTGAMTDYGYSSGSTFYNSDIESIVITSGVTTIGGYAFRSCYSLRSVTIPDSVTTIGNEAFCGCYSLRSVTIPDSVTTIGDAAFCDCDSLTSITIPDSVTTIGDSAFSSCGSITSVTIPNSVITIGISAFSSCGSLTSVTIPDSVTTIDVGAFRGCSSLTSITIPDSVTSIGDYAFDSCGRLTSVTIPDSVTIIGDDAFCGCSSLTNIIIPDSVTTIGNDAFKNCDSLTSVTIPDSVTTVGNGAFSFCDSLTSVTIPDSVTTMGYSVFSYCTSLTSVTIPDSVTTIGADAFYNCTSLTSVTIPDSVTTIGAGAFYGCYSLTSITIPDRVTTIDDNAFYGCYSLTSITIPDRVTTIGNDAFMNCDSLTSVTIPDSVTTVGNRAFSFCDSLTSVTIPDSVTTIGNGAFSHCDSLTSVMVDRNNNYYSSDENGVLFDKNKTKLIQYPIGNVRTEYTIPDSVTTICNDAFRSCDSLKSVTIPDSVTTICTDAFSFCYSLTSVIIPVSVTTIWEYAFCNGGLTSITFRNPETQICDSSSTISTAAVIYGYEGSTAQSYAEKYNREFVVITPDDNEDFIETLQYGADRFSFGKNVEGHIGESVNSLVLYESALNDTTALIFTSTNTDVVEIGEIQHGTGEYITLKNQHIATVPLIFKGEGTSVITVTSPDGLSSSVTVSVKPVVYELKLYSTVSTLLVGKGRSIGAAVELEKNGVPIGAKCEYSFAVSDSDIVSISDVKISNSDNNTYFTINGLEEGAAKLTITEQSTGAMYSATVTVNKGILTYNAEALPKYYDGKHECNGIISGMYIDEFSSTQTDDSNMSVSFNVYNTTGLVGVVAVYDADGNLKESLPIKRFDGGIISSVYETLKECYYLVKDLTTGNILSYKQSSYSEKTEIKNIKVPKGGRIEITNDIMYSDTCCLLNVSELAINTILLLGDTIKGLSSEEIKKVAEESSVTLLKNKVLEKAPGLTEEFREKVIKSIMSDIGNLAIADALNIITDNVTKIFSDFNIDFTKLVVDSAASVTVGIAEDAFAAATSFVGVALKGMFVAADYLELSAFIMNFAMSRSESAMKIYFDDENGCLSDDGVTIKAENGMADLSESNFVMHSVVISDGDLMADVIKEALDNVSDEYVLRDIYLERDGVVSQPDQPVLVSIPVPAGYIDVTLYWVKDDGTLVEIPYTFTGGKYITFRTNHFSYYAIVNSKNEDEVCKEHIDNDGDFLCDNGCGFEFEKPDEPNLPDDPINSCSHLCHKTGFLGFIWKIINFFQKLFGISPVCECGAAHY